MGRIDGTGVGGVMGDIGDMGVVGINVASLRAVGDGRTAGSFASAITICSLARCRGVEVTVGVGVGSFFRVLRFGGLHLIRGEFGLSDDAVDGREEGSSAVAGTSARRAHRLRTEDVKLFLAGASPSPFSSPSSSPSEPSAFRRRMICSFFFASCFSKSLRPRATRSLHTTQPTMVKMMRTARLTLKPMTRRLE